MQVSNLELKVAAHKEIDGDGGPDCRSEAKLELVASGADGLRDDSEAIGSHVVEREVLDGWVSEEIPRAREGADENWV